MRLNAKSPFSHRGPPLVVSHPRSVEVDIGVEAGVCTEAEDPGRDAGLRVAAFTSSETRRVGRDLGFAVAVVAVSKDPAAHARLLSRRWHAAWTAREGWFQPFDDGMADVSTVEFSMMRFDARWMGRWALPRGVSVDCGALSVDLPRDRRRDFAEVFASAMADRRFDQIASRPAQVRRRYATGRMLAVPPRYAGHPALGFGGPGFALVEDLYCFRPHDLPGVAAAAANAAAVVSLRMTLADVDASARELCDA